MVTIRDLASRTMDLVPQMGDPVSPNGGPGFSVVLSSEIELSGNHTFVLLEETNSEALSDWKSVHPFGL